MDDQMRQHGRPLRPSPLGSITVELLWLGALIACAVALPSGAAVIAEWFLIGVSVVLRLVIRSLRKEESSKRPARATPWWALVPAIAGASGVFFIAHHISAIRDHRVEDPSGNPWFIPVLVVSMTVFWAILNVSAHVWGTQHPAGSERP